MCTRVPSHHLFFIIDKEKSHTCKGGRFNANMALNGVASGGLGSLEQDLMLLSILGERRRQRRCQMTPEMILTQDKKKFQIEYASIQSIELSTPGLMQTATIKIFTPGKEHKFTIQTDK